ncbi:MAG: hypothetical protein IJD80_06520 [Oscillospiraceae bacterium]|nr:hypothetical protein [Oscillospiraceae bacterium]
MGGNNPAAGSIKQQLHSLLGCRLEEKYNDIIPLLALCEYRLRTYRSYGTFDMMFSTEETTPALKIYRTCLFPFAFIKNMLTSDKKDDKVMLSATILKNDRYRSLVADISKTCQVVKTNTMSDIVIWSPSQSLSEYLHNTFGGKRILNGKNITGTALKKAVINWLEFVLYLSENGKTCTDEAEKADHLLSCLKKNFEQRLDEITDALKNSGIKLYITINQYNMRDFVLISAFRKLGVKTRQLEHHASRFMHNTRELDEIYRFCFVDEICCWSESEVDFHNNVYSYECFTGKDSPLIYSVGNPEISYSDAVAATEKYPVKNRITFMVSGILNSNDEKSLAKQLALRNSIFSNLKKLSDEKNIKILVRYPPGIDMNFRRAEEQTLIDMGFEISPSDRNSLLSDICGSCAVIGTISSVLGLSALMGKKVYQVAGENEKFHITDKNIFTIKADEICNIITDTVSAPLEKSDFMDCSRLMEL